MRTVLRLVIGLLGLFNIAIGFGFLLAPERLAAAFALVPIGSQGLATLRADFPGFFVGAAIFALVGAWRCRPEPLLVPIVMLGLAIFGRSVSLVADGVGPAALPPMFVEAVMIAVLVAGYRSFAAAGRP